MLASARFPVAAWHAWLRRRAAERSASEPLAALLRAPKPSPALRWQDAAWLAVDIETTSLDAAQATLVSIGWVPVERGRIVLAGAGHFVVAGGDDVGQSATVHRVTDSSREAGISVRAALDALWRAAGGRIPVFHGSALDVAVIDRLAVQQFNAPWRPWHADTLLIEHRRRERSAQPLRAGDLTLANLRAAYHLPSMSAHHALADALATAELFLAQCAVRGAAPTLGELLR